MTKINTPEPEENDEEMQEDPELEAFAKKAGELADVLLPNILAVAQTSGANQEHAVLACLFCAAHLAHGIGASRDDFAGAAEDAFDDIGEMLTEQAKTTTQAVPTDVKVTLAEGLVQARALIVRGWCQNEMATKWVVDRNDTTKRKKIGCAIDDPYASRWSALGALDAIFKDADRASARELLLKAVAACGHSVTPGALIVTALTDWNDYGYVPPLPPEVPVPPNAPEEFKAKIAADRAELLKQWPQPVAHPRTRADVLAVFDKAIELAGSMA